MRFLVVDNNVAERNRLRDAVVRCAEEAHHSYASVVALGTISECAEMLGRLPRGFFDALLCCVDVAGGIVARPARSNLLDGQTPLEQLTDIARHYDNLDLVIASRDPSFAHEAYRLSASFLLLPGSYESLARALHKALSKTGWRQKACLAVRSAGRIDNIAFDDIQFVESSKRGPIIHLPAKQQIVARGTLRNLFDQIARAQESFARNGQAKQDAPDQGAQLPFVMAGSSFVVNLDNVLASGKGALVFADGETIIVPVRKRKDIEAALAARRGRRSSGADEGEDTAAQSEQ